MPNRYTLVLKLRPGINDIHLSYLHTPDPQDPQYTRLLLKTNWWFFKVLVVNHDNTVVKSYHALSNDKELQNLFVARTRGRGYLEEEGNFLFHFTPRQLSQVKILVEPKPDGKVMHYSSYHMGQIYKEPVYYVREHGDQGRYGIGQMEQVHSEVEIIPHNTHVRQNEQPEHPIYHQYLQGLNHVVGDEYVITAQNAGRCKPTSDQINSMINALFTTASCALARRNTNKIRRSLMPYNPKNEAFSVPFLDYKRLHSKSIATVIADLQSKSNEELEGHDVPIPILCRLARENPMRPTFKQFLPNEIITPKEQVILPIYSQATADGSVKILPDWTSDPNDLDIAIDKAGIRELEEAQEVEVEEIEEVEKLEEPEFLSDEEWLPPPKKKKKV